MTNTSDSAKPVNASSAHTAVAMDRRLLVIPLIAVFAAGFIMTIITTVSGGTANLSAGLIGTAVVAAFFGFSQYVMSRVLRKNPAIATNMAMLTYVVQIAFLFVLLIFLKDATFFNAKVFAGTVVVCAFAWIIAAVVLMMKSNVLYVEPGSGPEKPY